MLPFHANAEQDENKGVGQKGGVFPDGKQDDFGRRGHTTGTDIAVDQTRHHHREDAAEVKLFCQDKAAVGQDGRKRYFDKMVVDLLDQLSDSVAEDAADEDAADRYAQKFDQTVDRIESAFQTQGQHNVEEYDGGAVVEQTLPFDKRHKPPRRADGSEGSHDSHRVGRGDKRAEDQGCRQGQHASDNEHGGDDAGAEQHTRHRHGYDRRQVSFQIFQLQMESGFKDQRRDKQAKHQSRRQFQVHAAADSQYQPGADQRHSVRETHAAHGPCHKQYDGQNLDDFKFQLEESFHYSLQNSRGAAW